MIDRRVFEEMVKYAEDKRDVDYLKKLMEIEKAGGVLQPPIYGVQQDYIPPRQMLEKGIDPVTGNKIVKIDVQVMVENLLGGHNENRDVQVTLEKYGRQMHTMMTEDQLAFVVVNICNLQTKEIITLREQYHKFPSSEFLTKLELLRVGDEVK